MRARKPRCAIDRDKLAAREPIQAQENERRAHSGEDPSVMCADENQTSGKSADDKYDADDNIDNPAHAADRI